MLSIKLVRWLSLIGLILVVGCGAPPPTALSTPPPLPSSTVLPATAGPSSSAPLRLPTLPPATTSGAIRIDGSSTVFPITEVAAQRFRELLPNVALQIGVSGTGGGFRTFCAGETDLANASRPINAEEAAACAANGIAFVELPVAFDGLSVVIHPSNTWATCLSRADLAKIWSPQAEGTVMRWNQVRPEWPDQPLNLYGAGTDSGTYDYFTSAIVGEEGVSRSDFTGSEDDYLLAQDVSADPNSLGFFGYAYYAEYRDSLQLAAIDAGAGCVIPSDPTIADGSYQPLSRPIFIYLNRAALVRPEFAAFAEFYLANAAAFVGQVGYTPLTDELYGLIAQRLANQQPGSIFSGGAEVGVSLEDLLRLER